MPRIIVHSLIAIPRRPSKKNPAFEFPKHTAFKLLSYDGSACLVKPLGKGNHHDFMMNHTLVAFQISPGKFVPVKDATVSDVIYAITERLMYLKEMK